MIGRVKNFLTHLLKIIASIIYPKNFHIANALCIVCLIRYILPFFDFEERRFRQDSAQCGLFLGQQALVIMMIGLMHNLIINTYVVGLEIAICILCIYYGSLRLFLKDQSVLEYLEINYNILFF